MANTSIKPQQPVMDAERVLDFLGRPFDGKYVLGAAEWLKNSYDHDLRTEEPGDPAIVFRIKTPRGVNSKQWTMECLDFLGTTFGEIDEHLKEWGSEIAASRGRQDWAGYGGHGNGGKFHMRQNFFESRFITYRNGALTVFGFDEDQRYGFDPRYRGASVSPARALAVAGIDPNAPELPDDIKLPLKSGDPAQCRFTLVRGIGFRHAQRWRKRVSFSKELASDPQAKQVLERARVIFVGDTEIIDPLLPPAIPDREGFEDGRTIDVPGRLPYDGEEFDLSKEASAGTLTLRVARDPFSKYDPSHAVDVKGRHGVVIATYRVTSLPIVNRVGADFIHGVLDCPALDDHGLRQNERQTLVPNDITDAVLEGVAAQVDVLSDELAEKENQKDHERRAASIQALTSRLNRWKNRFLKAREISVTVGTGEGAGLGGSGGGGTGGTGVIHSGDGSGKNGQGAGAGSGGSGLGEGGGGSGDEKRKASRFPDIRVSGYDPDPLTGSSFRLHPRQPVVYQRTEDVEVNLWWINAQRPLAERIINEDGPKSARWYDYVFNRFVEVIEAYCIRDQWDGTTEIAELMWQLIGEIHDSAATDLRDVLFDASLDGAAEGDTTPEQPSTEASAATEPVASTRPIE